MQAQATTPPFLTKSIQDQVLQQRSQLTEHSTQILSYILQYSLKLLSAASAQIFLAIVVPIISFFMLKDGARLREELIDLVAPGRNRELMEDV